EESYGASAMMKEHGGNCIKPCEPAAKDVGRPHQLTTQPRPHEIRSKTLVPSCLCGYLCRVKDVAALLLAAGRSRRMGAFKPLLPFGDRTVIERCVANLRAAGVREVIVVLGHRADEVRAHLGDSEVRFAFNTE